VTSSAVSHARSTSAVVATVRDRAWLITVWGAMAVWSAVLFVVVCEGFVGFRVGRFDLGNMVQAVWSTTQGRPLEVTAGATGEQMTRLGGHVDPFLVLLAPAWMVWPSPLVLGLAQIVAVSSGALPVFWLARRHLGSERTAGLLALGYLAYPWLAVTAVASIHPVTFAVPLLLFCVWFLDSERLLPFAICAALAMSTGELMGVPVVGLGIWFALARGRRVAGAAIALAGAAWTFVAVYVIVGAFSGEDSIFYGFYEEVGGSPDGVLRTLITDPGVIAAALFEAHDVIYFVWLGLPLLFLFVLSPGLALVAVPQLLANGLSDFRSMTDPRYHSLAAIVPFLIAATVFGIGRVRPSRQTSAAAAVLVCSATIALFVGPWARAVGMTPLGGRENVSAQRVDALSAAIALVPDDAAVSVSNVAGAHLSARRYVYSVPTLGRATWVVVDRSDPWVVSRGSPILTNHPEVVRAFVARMKGDPDWRPVFDRSGVVVFQRASDE
jgi:uncharacterized membrane protein